MSNDRFLVSLKMSLVHKTHTQIKHRLKKVSISVNQWCCRKTTHLLYKSPSRRWPVASSHCIHQLGEESRQISNNNAGYLSHKTRDGFASHFGNNLKSYEGNLGFIWLFLHGKLINPTVKYGDIASKAFTLLDSSSTAISKCSIRRKMQAS